MEQTRTGEVTGFEIQAHSAAMAFALDRRCDLHKMTLKLLHVPAVLLAKR